MAKRDRTNASKADVQSKRMCIDLDSTKPTRASNTNVFRLLDLPAEIRVNVCKHIFSPMSSSDKHAALHDPCLSLTWVNDGSAAQVQLHKRSGFHFSRPTDYKFLFTSKQIYAEALPILARSTSLRLSGTTYHELQKLLRNDPNLKYLIHLFNEVANNTSHLIIDQPVLRTDLSFRDNLVHGTLFPNLQKLTVHQAGPSQLSTAREEDALTDEEAATLAISRKWQCQKWERDFALVFDSLNAVSCRWMLDHHPLVSFPFMLCALTADLTTSKNDSLRRRHKLDTVEVVWSVGIKGLVTSAQGEHVVFNKAEIYLDLETLKITDVGFSKQHTRISRSSPRLCMFPPQYREFWCASKNKVEARIRKTKEILSGTAPPPKGCLAYLSDEGHLRCRIHAVPALGESSACDIVRPK